MFSHWQGELGPCRTNTSLQIGSCSNQLYNGSYCSDLFNHSQVYIIAENIEKALTVWRNVHSRIDSGDSPKMLPTRAEVAVLYHITTKHSAKAKGHAALNLLNAAYLRHGQFPFHPSLLWRSLRCYFNYLLL